MRQEARRPRRHAPGDTRGAGFGWENSLGTTSAEMLGQLRVFAAHDATWMECETDIIVDRDQMNQVAPDSRSMPKRPAETSAFGAELKLPLPCRGVQRTATDQTPRLIVASHRANIDLTDNHPK